MDVQRFHATQHRRTTRALDRLLRRVEAAQGLGAALQALVDVHGSLRFMAAPAPAQRWELVDAHRPWRRLAAQYNPTRAARPVADGGAATGIPSAPSAAPSSAPPSAPPSARPSTSPSAPAPKAAAAACALCPQGVQRLQAFREFGYRVCGEAPLAWWAYPNPYPLWPVHCVVATDAHLPQGWIHASLTDTARDLARVLDPLLDLAGRLRGFVVWHNGPGAGATQPHLHLQLAARPEGQVFGLERAAERAGARGARRSAGDGEAVVLGGDHPVSAVAFTGPPAAVMDGARQWTQRWLQALRARAPTLSANLVAMADPEGGRGDVTLLFVPRNRTAARVPMLSGMPGALEMLGELVLTSERELHLLQSGRLDHAAAWKCLNAVDTPGLPRSGWRAAGHPPAPDTQEPR